MSLAGPGDIDGAAVFTGAGWFRITGIIPAISPPCAELSLEAVKTAMNMGLHVSCEMNYRINLWKFGKAPHDVMGKLMQYADTVIANKEDIQKALSTATGHRVTGWHLDASAYESPAEDVKNTFPQCFQDCHRTSLLLQR